MESTIPVYLKQLVFLRHIRRLALDYYTRVLEEISKTRLSPTKCITESVPDTLTQKKTTLFYKKRYGELRFSLKRYEIETTQSHDENASTETGQNETKTENTSYGRIVLYMDDCGVRSDELTQHDLDNLTEVMTQEIYSYIELVNKYLQDSKSVGSGVSEKLIMTGRAILNEILGEESEAEIETCPREVVANLDQLPDVHGYGFSTEGFCVLAIKRSEAADIKLKKQIEYATSSWKFPKLIWLKNEPFYPYMHAGCRLVSQSQKKKYEHSSGKHGCGSIGVFGTTDGGQMVFTTAGHIFYAEGEKAYVAKKETHAIGREVNQSGASVLPPSPSVDKLRLIGTCVGHLGQGLDNDADFTLVQVDSTATTDCKQQLQHPDYEMPLEKQLYTKPPGKLRDKFVQTLRTEILPDGSIMTDYTDGIVVLDPYYFTGSDLQRKRNYIGVTGKNSNAFALPGHSGAPVIKTEFANGRAVAKVVSSILYGPILYRTNGDDEDGAGNDGEQDTSDVYKDCVYTWRMDEALSEEGIEKGIMVNINTI